MLRLSVVLRSSHKHRSASAASSPVTTIRGPCRGDAHFISDIACRDRAGDRLRGIGPGIKDGANKAVDRHGFASARAVRTNVSPTSAVLRLMIRRRPKSMSALRNSPTRGVTLSDRLSRPFPRQRNYGFSCVVALEPDVSTIRKRVTGAVAYLERVHAWIELQAGVCERRECVTHRVRCLHPEC
jgi:hypothetical protein